MIYFKIGYCWSNVGGNKFFSKLKGVLDFKSHEMTLVSLRNRTAERRGRSVTNVTGRLLTCFVRNSLKIDLFCSSTKRSV